MQKLLILSNKQPNIQLRTDKTRKLFVCHAATGKLNAPEAESAIAIYRNNYAAHTPYWGVLLYGLFIRIATPLAFSQCIHGKLLRWRLQAAVRHLVCSSQDDAVSVLLGHWSRPTENKEY